MGTLGILGITFQRSGPSSQFLPLIVCKWTPNSYLKCQNCIPYETSVTAENLTEGVNTVPFGSLRVRHIAYACVFFRKRGWMVVYIYDDEESDSDYFPCATGGCNSNRYRFRVTKKTKLQKLQHEYWLEITPAISCL